MLTGAFSAGRWCSLSVGRASRKIHQGHYHHYEDFIEVLAKLNPPLDKRFIEIMDEQLDVIPYEFSEMFIDGFKLGAKIMAEVFRCG